jgi:GR25 family glycosyltransferase involved in LPS biosynthesis
MIPVTVISLPGSADRRAALCPKLDSLGIHHQIFSTHDGTTVAAPVGGYYRPLLPAEVGCAASHLAVLRQIAEGDSEFACVLEDDVAPSAGLPTLLEPATLAQLPRFDVLRLGANIRPGPRFGRLMVEMAATNLYAMLRPWDACFAQIYSREGARRIVERVTAIEMPLDAVLYEETHIIVLRILEARPRVVGYSDAPSLIGDRSLERPRSLARRVAHRVERELRACASYLRAWGIRGVLGLRIVRVQS